MENSNSLISIWKSQTTSPNVEINNILNHKNTNVMETIIKFENKEKAEKNKQIAAAVVLSGLTVMNLYAVELTTFHFVGLILLIIGVALSIIANRTDNFPDFRLLDTIAYLEQYRENTIKRNKMHIINSILSGLFVLPGLYFTFRTSFTDLGNWWIPIMLVSATIPLIFWFREYNKRSKLVIEKVSTLLGEFNDVNKNADN